jgi:PAS domain S-box-containing protein
LRRPPATQERAVPGDGRLEAGTRESTRFRRILDAVRDAVTLFDPVTLRLVYANDGAVEQLGRSREELLTLTPADLSVELTPDLVRELMAPLLSGEIPSRTLVLTRQRPDGTTLPVESVWQYVALPGEPAHVVAISRDISERLEHEARLATLAASEHSRAAQLNAIIRAIGDGILVCDGSGRITLTNPAARAILPEPAEWTLAGVLAMLDDPDGRAPVPGAQTDPIELRTRDGTDRWIEVSSYPVDPERESGETIVVFRDVTATREQRAVRDAFVWMLSHELRTPVTTIYAGAKVLARGSSALSDEARREIFEDVHAEAERLHRLVEDVVALSRFGEGPSEIGNEPVLVQRVLPTVAHSEQGRWPGVRFRLSIPSDLPPVAADATYVEQVLRNLLANAAKYGGQAGSVEVRVESSADEVVVRVLDEGPGFPAGEADRLFEIFYRSPSTATNATGAGIGLYVCARLVAAMNGRIWAAPRPTGGAEFGFALRIMDEAR